jgi:hypothetical protein
MARTYTQLRQLTVQQTGLRWTTGTSDSGGTVSIMRDAALSRYGEDYWNGHHLLLTSGSPTYTELFVHDFISDDGDVRFRPEEGAAPNSLAYELLPFSATDILYAIQDSILTLYDLGLLSRDFWMQIVGGSPLYNADWGYWTSSSQPDGWTITSSTAARERASGNLALSETSLRLDTASGYAAPTAQYKRYLQDFKGRTVTLYCWVLTSTSSNARLGLYDGSTVTYSAYHSGDGDWELLHVEDVTADTDSNLEPRLVIDTTSSAYFNLTWLSGGNLVRTYPFPHQLMPDGPYEVVESGLGIEEDQIADERGLGAVRQSLRGRNVTGYRTAKHHDEDTTTQTGILDLSLSPRPPRDGRLLWLRGDGPLTVPSSVLATTNIEVTESESLLLATLAAIKLFERASASAASSTRRLYDDRMSDLHRQLSELASGAGEQRDTATYHIGW